MKIKEVCRKTELTDRAVRYYIEERLLKPSFTENYLGRRSFDFSDGDIAALNDIATLRKFGFSVAEIREIQSNPMNSIEIIKSLKAAKQADIDENAKMLEALEELGSFSDYDAHELTCRLEKYTKTRELPNDERLEKVKGYIHSAPKTALCLIAIILPVAFIIISFKRFLYPDFTLWSVIALLLASVPAIFGVKILFSQDNHYGALAACLVCLPLSFILSYFAFSGSTTTNINNYLVTDKRITADEIFPANAHTFDNVQDEHGSLYTEHTDAKYYYRCKTGFDYTYDIYAEWRLEKDDFYSEVERVQAIYKDKQDECKERNWDNIKFAEIKKGGYICLFEYHDMFNGDKPFNEVTGNYDYTIFAYDETNYTVRYINCYSLQDGTEQPYYLKLEW